MEGVSSKLKIKEDPFLFMMFLCGKFENRMKGRRGRKERRFVLRGSYNVCTERERERELKY